MPNSANNAFRTDEVSVQGNGKSHVLKWGPRGIGGGAFADSIHVLRPNWALEVCGRE